MKVAAAYALAELAREDVPDEVAAAYHGSRPQFRAGTISSPPHFDPRLISFIPPFVAQAAMDTGTARKPIEDMDEYRALSSKRRQDPSASFLKACRRAARMLQRRIVFAEGEEPSGRSRRLQLQEPGPRPSDPDRPRSTRLHETMEHDGCPRGHARNRQCAPVGQEPGIYRHLYGRLQREGYLKRDVQRLVNNDRNVFGSCMLKNAAMPTVW
jgi:malate dehydrogenase (oxaloacetate-decarboxylating)(NADP+)